MESLLKRLFPLKKELIKLLFFLHFSLLAWFSLDRSIPIDYHELRFDTVYFMHLLNGLLFLAFFWILSGPSKAYTAFSLHMAIFLELVSIAIDMYMMFCHKCWSQTLSYWIIDLLTRFVTFLFLLQMSVQSNGTESESPEKAPVIEQLNQFGAKNRVWYLGILVFQLSLFLWFALDNSLPVNNYNLVMYRVFFLYLVSGFLFLALLWAIIQCHSAPPVHLSVLISFVAIFMDAYVLYLFYWGYAFKTHLKMAIFYHLLLAVRVISFIILDCIYKRMMAIQEFVTVQELALYNNGNSIRMDQLQCPQTISADEGKVGNAVELPNEKKQVEINDTLAN